MNKTLLFSYSIEGGGDKIYKLASNKILETGNSGGILDESEDPLKHWEKEFDSWPAWWAYFMDDFKQNWIKTNPVFIHPDIKDFIKNELDKYLDKAADNELYFERWYRQL